MTENQQSNAAPDSAPWDVRFLGAPAWAYVNPARFVNAVARRHQPRNISVPTLVVSAFKTVRFLVLDQKKYDAVVFITARCDALRFCDYLGRIKGKNYALFLNPERKDTRLPPHYTSCTTLNVVRFGFRVLSRCLVLSRLRLTRAFAVRGYRLNRDQRHALMDFIGDAIFTRFLSMVLRRGLPVFHANAVIPITERFQGFLDSREVQHGVLYHGDLDYATARTVKNTLIVYDEIYRQILHEAGYDGTICVWPFKRSGTPGETTDAGRYRWDAVVFTQPIGGVPEREERLVQQFIAAGLRVAVQRHPRDTYRYPALPSSVFCESIEVDEAAVAVSYCSTAVEPFLAAGKSALLFDAIGMLGTVHREIVDVFRRFEARDGGELKIFSDEQEVLRELLGRAGAR